MSTQQILNIFEQAIEKIKEENDRYNIVEDSNNVSLKFIFERLVAEFLNGDSLLSDIQIIEMMKLLTTEQLHHIKDELDKGTTFY